MSRRHLESQASAPTLTTLGRQWCEPRSIDRIKNFCPRGRHDVEKTCRCSRAFIGRHYESGGLGHRLTLEREMASINNVFRRVKPSGRLRTTIGNRKECQKEWKQGDKTHHSGALEKKIARGKLELPKKNSKQVISNNQNTFHCVTVKTISTVATTTRIP